MSKKSGSKASPPEIIHRRAPYEYHFVQEYVAGIALTGTEVKSLRTGNANLTDAYCLFENGELWIKNLHIAEYDYGSDQNHDPRRIRKLLLRKSELRKLERRVREKGLTIIPFKIAFNERGLAKVHLALAMGKKAYDKRETIKQRDEKRQIDRLKKIYK